MQCSLFQSTPFLQNGVCQANCSLGWFNSNNICVTSCASKIYWANCSCLTGTGQCKYYIVTQEQDTVCVSSCPSSAQFSFQKLCVSQCAAPSQYVSSTDNSTCVSLCASNIYNSSNFCLQSTQSCKVYYYNSTRIQCDLICPSDVQYLSGKLCVSTCGMQYVEVDKRTCSNNCSTNIRDLQQCINSTGDCPGPRPYFQMYGLTLVCTSSCTLYKDM